MKHEHSPHKEAPCADLSVVITPCKARASLARALASLAEQRSVRLEVLVIDDAQNPSCEEVTRQFRQEGLNVHCCQLPTGTGLLGCQLRGLELATSPCLAFMDADTILTGPDAFAEALAARVGDPDILHFLTLSQTRWGACTLDKDLAPIADKPLQGREIFSRWLESGCKAPAVWTKIYSRRLSMAVAQARHVIKISSSAEYYLSAWFFLLAQSYQPAAVTVYQSHAQKDDSLEKAGERAVDCLRLYLELPGIFADQGLPESQCESLRQYLRLLVTINGTKACEYIMDGRDDAPDAGSLKKLLRCGSEEDIFLALAVANGSNALKLRDITQILYYSW